MSMTVLEKIKLRKSEKQAAQALEKATTTEGDVTAIQENIDTIEEDVSTIDDAVTAVEETVVTHGNSLVAHQNSIDNHEDRLVTIEAEDEIIISASAPEDTTKLWLDIS